MTSVYVRKHPPDTNASRVESIRRRRRRRPSQRVDARTNRGHAKIVSRRLASSRAHLERRLLRRRLRRRLDRLHRAARSFVSHPPITHTRARARIITDPIARVSLARTRVVRFHPSRASETYADHRARLPTPLARVSLDSTPPSRRLARTSTTVSIASARTASSLDIVRPLPLVAREGPRRDRSVGRERKIDRDRVSFAFLSRSVVQIPPSVCIPPFVSLSRVHTDPLAPSSPVDGAAVVSCASESPFLSHTRSLSSTRSSWCDARARGGCAWWARARARARDGRA